MIKKYAMIVAILLVILILVPTSTASFVFSKGKIYEMLPENSKFKKILDKLSQIASNNDEDVLIDADENDEEYDDGEYDNDSDDGLEENVLLPKIWDLVGEKTPDNGNKPIDGSEDTSNTIDHPDGNDNEVVWNNGTVGPDGDDGGVVWGNGTVDSDGNEGIASNETTTPDYIDEGKWTVKQFVEIVTERNVKLGTMLERVIERTVATDGNGFFSGTNWIKGESVGTAKIDIVGHVIATAGEGNAVENDVVDDDVVLTDESQ
ncbi:MAG: hypothetical protein U9O49_00160 [Candidatus Thermoplasmatota archaeon]|nr:hypothetical protein [Candidatus Thermoplasmatota archaeon]